MPSSTPAKVTLVKLETAADAASPEAQYLLSWVVAQARQVWAEVGVRRQTPARPAGGGGCRAAPPPRSAAGGAGGRQRRVAARRRQRAGGAALARGDGGPPGGRPSRGRWCGAAERDRRGGTGA